MDLHLRCISSEPEERPTANEIVDLISRLPKSSGGGLRKKQSNFRVPAVQEAA